MVPDRVGMREFRTSGSVGGRRGDPPVYPIPDPLARQEYGLVTARRAWLEPGQVLNAQPWQVLADRRRDRFRSHAVAVGGLPDAPASSAFEEPARPLPSEHWPEPSEPTPDSPPHDDDADLATRLEDTPLDDALRERVDDYLRNGGDEPLEAALRQLGDPPMRVAFELLMG